MALLSAEDLEAAMGVTFTDADVAKAQYYINGLSSYIQHKTGVVFSVTTGAVERFRADAYGVVLLTKLPVQEITTVHDFISDTDVPEGGWVWDGLEHITNLCGWQVVDITYSYGLAVPDDVKWAATEACKRGMNNNANDGLVLKQVGDVIHQYAGMLPLNPTEQEIFNYYGITEWSIKTTKPPPPPYGPLSPSWPFDVSYEQPWL